MPLLVAYALLGDTERFGVPARTADTGTTPFGSRMLTISQNSHMRDTRRR